MEVPQISVGGLLITVEESKPKVVMEVDIHVAYDTIFESQKEPQKSSSQCSYFSHESEILRIA